MVPRRRPPAAAVFLVIVSVFIGDSLTCHPAEYEVDNECCPMCPAGTRVRVHCTELWSTSCLPCMEGTFTEKANGLKKCFSCTSCDPGSGLTVKKFCSGTSDTVCEPLEGFLCVDSSDRTGCTAARKHRSCEPGQYIHQKGTASSDTQCSPCSDGTFSDGNSTTCQQHTQCEELGLLQTTAGTASTDAQCEEEKSTGTMIAVSVGMVVLLVTLSVGVAMFIKRNPIFKMYFKQPNGGSPEKGVTELLNGPGDVKLVPPPAAELNLLSETDSEAPEDQIPEESPD